jgi:carboxypeptidase Q
VSAVAPATTRQGSLWVNPHPIRTIRFISWMNEENGVAGGRAYAEGHKSELENHVAAVELDYGDGRPLDLKVRGSESRLKPVAGILSAIGEPIGGLIPVDRSPAVDIEPLNEAGVPGIAPLQDAREYFNYHHTAADTFDKVFPGELRQTLEVIPSLVYAIAQHD